MELPPGTFGEILQSKGCSKTEVNIGDRFRIGATEVMASAPRLPCYCARARSCHLQDRFFGRPTVEDLRQDLRAVLAKCRPDWDITTPEDARYLVEMLPPMDS